ncbi:MAG TPA: hypothetical protein VL689_12245 [Paraburkholderia sp.]|nr:hypothetical protein [Paraburkholderia sp.]
MKVAAPVRVWALLTRVRQLRVQRARRELSDAHAGVERAIAETARQQSAIAEHAARRRQILAECSLGKVGASLWRGALHRHDAGRAALDLSLALARETEGDARALVHEALHRLQKETRGLDDARDEVRRLIAARADRDPDD